MGTNKANPSAMVLSATMMLRHLGLETQANTIASAVYDVIQEGKVRTADMRGGEFFGLTIDKRTDDRRYCFDFGLHQGHPRQGYIGGASRCGELRALGSCRFKIARTTRNVA
jgi:hypothetical protein